MITSIVGRLIKKPEVAERIQIPGKHVVNFTVVENRTRGERRLSVFFNLSLVIGTDAQFDLAMRLEKGTVLLFSSPRITYVRQSERSETEQSINLYAEAENFKIIAGAAEAAFAAGASAGGPELFEPAEEGAQAQAPPARAPAPMPQPRRSPSAAPPADRPVARPRQTPAVDERDDHDPFAESDPSPESDPFAEHEDEPRPSRAAPPAPARSASPMPARPAPGAAPRRPAQNAAPAPGPQAPPNTSRARHPIAAAPPEEDLSELSDPFAESDL